MVLSLNFGGVQSVICKSLNWCCRILKNSQKQNWSWKTLKNN